MTVYERTPETTPSRHPERARYDADTVHSILDEALIGHLAFVVDDVPQVLPTLFVRVDESIFLHFSTGAGPARLAKRRWGIPVSFEATLVDGLVLARSTFNHSANYRSVVVHGKLSLVDDKARKREVMRQLVEKIVPGRSEDARGPDDRELRQTAVMELPLETVSAKVRTGDPKDDARDMKRECWAGVVPLLYGRGAPVPAADLGAGITIPRYLGPQTPR